MEVVAALPDLFRQIEGAFPGGLILPVADLFRVVGIQGLQAAVYQMSRIRAVQLKAHTGFLNAPLGLFIDQLGKHSGLNAVLIVAAATAATTGLDDLLIVSSVAVAGVVIGTAIVPAVVVIVMPAAGRSLLTGRGGLFEAGIIAQKIKAQQCNDQKQHIHKGAHHIGCRLPEIVFCIRILSAFSRFHPECPTFRILTNSSTDSGREKR